MAISLIWTWFVSPVLQVPEISVLQGIGFSTFISVAIAPLMAKTIRYNAATKDFDKEVWSDFVEYLLLPLFTIVIAWLLHVFIQGHQLWLSSQPWLTQPWSY